MESSNPTSASDWFRRGVDLRSAGRYVDALSAFEKAIELAPSSPAPWNAKGAVLTDDLGRAVDGLAAFDRAIELDRGFSLAWNGRAVALGQIGRLTDSLIASEKAIELDPDDSVAWNTKGHQLLEGGHSAEALRAFDKAIELNPKFARAWTGRGTALTNLERDAQALKAFERATELNPKYAVAWNDLGRALNKLNGLAEALSAFDKAIELNPNYSTAWLNKAIVLRRDDELRNLGLCRACLARVVHLHDRQEDPLQPGVITEVFRQAENSSLSMMRWRLAELHPLVLTDSRADPRSLERETQVPRAVLEWIASDTSSLTSAERLELCGRVLVAFGDPAKAVDCFDQLDALDNQAVVEEATLAGQLYHIWSIDDCLGDSSGQLARAYQAAQRVLVRPKGEVPERALYYAGYIAFLSNDMDLSLQAFSLAKGFLPAQYMRWLLAVRTGDDNVAQDALSEVLRRELELKRNACLGYLIPVPLSPLDDLNREQDRRLLEWRLQRFELDAVAQELLESTDLAKHPLFVELTADLMSSTQSIPEAYEEQSRNWRVSENFKQLLRTKRLRSVRVRTKQLYLENLATFELLDVSWDAPAGKELIARIASKVYELDSPADAPSVARVLEVLYLSRRISAADLEMLVLYAYCRKADADDKSLDASAVKHITFVAIAGLIQVLGLAPYLAAFGAWTGIIAIDILSDEVSRWSKHRRGIGVEFPRFDRFKNEIHEQVGKHGTPIAVLEGLFPELYDEE